MVASMQNLEPNFMYAPINVECILQICLSIDRYCSYAGRRISIDFLYEYRSNPDKDNVMPSQYRYLIKLIWRKLLNLPNIQIRFWTENERLLRDSSNNTIIQGGGGRCNVASKRIPCNCGSSYKFVYTFFFFSQLHRFAIKRDSITSL